MTRTWHSLALAALTVLAAGCATGPRPTMTFQEAGIVGPGEPEVDSLPPARVEAPREVATDAPMWLPPIDPVLLRFAAQARERRARMVGGKGFPAEAIAAWHELAVQLDGYLSAAASHTPFLELVRASMTVEAEMEYDRRHYGEPPGELSELVSARLSRIGERVVVIRALGRDLLSQPEPPALRWPLTNAGISSVYGMRLHPLDGVRKMHYGIDLAAGEGRAVTAAARGVVVHAGWAHGHGLAVEIRHSGDLTTRYSHLSRVFCTAGDAVEQGDLVGLVGSTGRTTGAHLHFEVWRGGRARDPLALLGTGELENSSGN
jgi:murein DD-endopeptidase MepM/ murein hydrolase activator NlpD